MSAPAKPTRRIARGSLFVDEPAVVTPCDETVDPAPEAPRRGRPPRRLLERRARPDAA
jgi:hypothetical protein